MAHEQSKRVLKRIRKGAYECGTYLLLYGRWVNENWDGPLESYRPWRLYTRGSPLTRRAFLDAFGTRAEAQQFIAQEMGRPQPDPSASRSTVDSSPR